MVMTWLHANAALTANAHTVVSEAMRSHASLTFRQRDMPVTTPVLGLPEHALPCLYLRGSIESRSHVSTVRNNEISTLAQDDDGDNDGECLYDCGPITRSHWIRRFSTTKQKSQRLVLRTLTSFRAHSVAQSLLAPGSQADRAEGRTRSSPDPSKQPSHLAVP
jgi:hypothetical protein